MSANGHHHHFTLIDDDGHNVFHDKSGPAELSDHARYFLGGMLEHFGALMCVGNPTVNSYCRMWDFGFWAPVYKNWGWQNRTCTVRVASGGRFEYRGVDSSSNPYLTIPGAALCRSSTASATRSTRASRRARNTYDILAEQAENGSKASEKLKRVPDSLGAALEALDADELIQERDARSPLRRVQALQARRVGALPRRGDRLGARRDPRGAPVTRGGAAKPCAASPASSTATAVASGTSAAT